MNDLGVMLVNHPLTCLHRPDIDRPARENGCHRQVELFTDPFAHQTQLLSNRIGRRTANGWLMPTRSGLSAAKRERPESDVKLTVGTGHPY